MISLTWRMILVRRWHSLTVFLLATVAIGAAVAAPVFVASARRGIMSREVAAAEVAERTIVVQEAVSLFAGDPVSNQGNFGREAVPAVTTPGFRALFAVEFDVTVRLSKDGQPSKDPSKDPLLPVAYRDGFCDAVLMVAGRCVSGPGEVIVSDAFAGRSGLAVGTSIVVVATQFVSPGSGPAVAVQDGMPERVAVVGFYHPRDPDDPYWGSFAGARMRDASTTPILTDRRDLANIDHTVEVESALATPLPGTFSVDHLAALRADTDRTITRRGNSIPSTRIYDLLGRIDADFRTVGLAPAVGAVLLIALCWFVIYLAVTQTAQARRAELGMLALRGLASADRWWLAVAETVVPVVLGAFAGYVVAHLAVWGFGDAAQTGALDVTLGPLRYAAIALAGALAASLVAIRRDLRTPAVDLLRRVPARGARWRGGVALAVVVALAAVAIVQLYTAKGGDGSGLAPLAPAFGIIAAGLSLAGVLDAALGWLGGRLLRRGRLAVGLAALHLSRRHSGARLLSLLTVAVALLGFAAIATEVAADTRQRQAELSLGARTVVKLGVTRPEQVLTAVRTVDPAGEFAMAAVSLGNNGNNGPLLALDVGRLPQAALWPTHDARSAVEISQLIRPASLAAPTIIQGSVATLTVTLTLPPDRSDETNDLELVLALVPRGGGAVQQPVFGPLTSGTHSYHAEIACAAGCRVGDLSIRSSANFADQTITRSLTLHKLGQNSPTATVISGPGFGAWHDHSSGALRLAAGPQGLQLTFDRLSGRDLYLSPPDSPEKLALITAGQRTRLTVAASDGRPLAGTPVASLAELPRIGSDGSIVDLEALVRTDPGLPTTIGAEVWLGAAAPPDAVDRLRAAGLPVIATRTLDNEISTAKQRPISIGLRFFLVVAALAVVLGVAGLGVAASVERPARAEDLRWLRIQGLRRRKVLASGLWGYLIPVVGASVLGALIAEAAWRVTGAAVPTGERAGPPALMGWWLGRGTVLAWGLAGGVLAIVAVLLAVALFRAVTRRSGRHSSPHQITGKE